MSASFNVARDAVTVIQNLRLNWLQNDPPWCEIHPYKFIKAGLQLVTFSRDLEYESGHINRRQQRLKSWPLICQLRVEQSSVLSSLLRHRRSSGENDAILFVGRFHQKSFHEINSQFIWYSCRLRRQILPLHHAGLSGSFVCLFLFFLLFLESLTWQICSFLVTDPHQELGAGSFSFSSTSQN